MTVALKANLRTYEGKSNYSNRNEFIEAIHTIQKHAELLKMPPVARKLLEFIKGFIFDNKRIGVIHSSNEKIGELMNCSERTVRRGLSWFKENAFIESYKSKKPTTGRKAPDIKVFASLAKIRSIVSVRMSGSLSGSENESIPCESKEEGMKNDKHINSFIELPLSKSINKSNKENDSNIKSHKKYGIKKEIRAFLKEDHRFNCFDDIKQHGIEKKVQQAFIYTKSDMNDKECQKAILKAINKFVKDIEQGRKELKTDYYAALFTYLKNALTNHKNKIEREEEEQTKSVDPIEVDPVNDLSFLLNKRSNVRPQPKSKVTKKMQSPYGTDPALIKAAFANGEKNTRPDWFNESKAELDELEVY